MLRKAVPMGFSRADAVAAVLLITLCAALVFSAVGCPGFYGRSEKDRIVSCSNNLRQLGLAVVQYAQPYRGTMPSAYQNLWNRLAPHLGEDLTRPTGGDLFRCPSDKFIAKQEPWGEKNQCSYAPNADHTDGSSGPEQAGWRIEVPPGSGRYYGASYSPFTTRYKDSGTEECVVKIGSIASDTVLLAECWRKETLNSLFLDRPSLPMYATSGVPAPLTKRDGTLLEYYTRSGSEAMARVSATSGNVTAAGPFNFLRDYAGSGTDRRPVTFDHIYHLGRINVLFADLHAEPWEVQRLATGPGQGKYAQLRAVREIPYWNRDED